MLISLLVNPNEINFCGSQGENLNDLYVLDMSIERGWLKRHGE